MHGRALPTKGISFSLFVLTAVCMNGSGGEWLVAKKKWSLRLRRCKSVKEETRYVIIALLFPGHLFLAIISLVLNSLTDAVDSVVSHDEEQQKEI